MSLDTGWALALGAAWALVMAEALSTRARRAWQRPASDATSIPGARARLRSAPCAPASAATGQEASRPHRPAGSPAPLAGPSAPAAWSPITALGAVIRRLAGPTAGAQTSRPVLGPPSTGIDLRTVRAPIPSTRRDGRTARGRPIIDLRRRWADASPDASGHHTPTGRGIDPPATSAAPNNNAPSPTHGRAGSTASPSGSSDHHIPAPSRLGWATASKGHREILGPTTVSGPCDAHTVGDRRLGWAAVAGGVLLPVAPVLAAVPLTLALGTPMVAARRARARHESGLRDQLPDVVDLLALTTAAGLPVSASLQAVDDRPGGPLGAALGQAAALVRRGGSTSQALAMIAEVGDPARPLVDALAQHDRYGTPLLPALERVAIEARARRRRQAEEAARRLPVTLLFPLVLTTFPAFVLLTVVPLLAGSLGSLSLSPT